MRFLEVVSFPDPTNPSADCFQYDTWGGGLCAGVGRVWEQDYPWRSKVGSLQMMVMIV